jgi:hypothetical protein
MLGFLEKAGLVKMDRPDTPVPEPEAQAPAAPTPVPEADPQHAPEAAVARALTPEALADIYARAQVPASLYPAERLLRLLDGLGAMDPGTRLMAIQAMDAADESWTIADPLADAAAKAQALAAHGQALSAQLQGFEADALARKEAVARREEKVLADIHKQMAELEALMAREVARAAKDNAALDGRLAQARAQTAGELMALNQLGQQLGGLAAQFQPAATARPE